MENRRKSKLIRDMESGKTVIPETRILKQIRIELEEEIAAKESARIDVTDKKLISNVLKAAQMAIEERLMQEHLHAEKAQEQAHSGLYRDLEKGYALACIDEIIGRAQHADRALRLIELFISNELTIEQIDRILCYQVRKNKKAPQRT